MILGHIDLLRDNNIHGWLGDHAEKIYPIVTANGKPCRVLAHEMERPDVADATGLTSRVGFVCELPANQTGIIDIQLYALATTGKLSFIDSKQLISESTTTAPAGSNPAKKKNIVLIWKQHDAGLYGRRVDQIARALAATQDYQNVMILELITSQQLSSYKEGALLPQSDKKFIKDDYYKKLDGLHFNGVNYKTLLLNEERGKHNAVSSFFSQSSINSSNTVVILFPLITEYWQVLEAIQGYVAICDCVDNQTVWSQNDPIPVLQQYVNTCFFSKKIIFNSAANLNFFIDNGYCSQKNSLLIENWYQLPPSFNSVKKSSSSVPFRIVYSGNMNDRINWDLLRMLHDATDSSISIHLIGSADSATHHIDNLTNYSSRFVYHGPMRENDLLNFLLTCDLAIMPHLHDNCSTYMNPLKLHMYSAIKLHCITTPVPGIDKSLDYISICKNDADFITKCKTFIKRPKTKKKLFRLNKDKQMKAYIKMVSKVLNNF